MMAPELRASSILAMRGRLLAVRCRPHHLRGRKRVAALPFEGRICRPSTQQVACLKRDMKMDIDKLTERSRGFLQAAQTIAIREFHQRLTPEHLLKALLDDEEGAAAGLIRAAGGDPQAAKAVIDAEIARQPKVQGGGAGQPQITPDLVRVLDAAQQTATKAGDEYVAQDRLLVALAAGDTAGARALRPAGAAPQALEKAVADIRKGRKVTSQNAEQSFDALKKYARDVTELARSGKL